ncbi:hypothetical protein A9Q84_14885 [Halobacteriovorax marinus]|uniref:DoxX family protein n=1 Tax=Halobacteriovorax marinus TaxID=97084 RepID=A0A1Y5FAX2_9BACT|nr:hypothetical protein A9Q84_14885 [Halobacteriovorax marinus]
MFRVYALSIALALSFLSAVADRFGLWGAPGVAGVAWGNYANFLLYTKHLNAWAPEFLISILGAVATALEVALALCLLIGFKRRYAALASGGLLSLFAISMIFADGLKGPFDYGVFSAAAGAFLLAGILKEEDTLKSQSSYNHEK